MGNLKIEIERKWKNKSMTMKYKEMEANAIVEWKIKRDKEHRGVMDKIQWDKYATLNERKIHCIYVPL